jgi:hypothetical protein
MSFAACAIRKDGSECSGNTGFGTGPRHDGPFAGADGGVAEERLARSSFTAGAPAFSLKARALTESMLRDATLSGVATGAEQATSAAGPRQSSSRRVLSTNGIGSYPTFMWGATAGSDLCVPIPKGRGVNLWSRAGMLYLLVPIGDPPHGHARAENSERPERSRWHQGRSMRTRNSGQRDPRRNLRLHPSCGTGGGGAPQRRSFSIDGRELIAPGVPCLRRLRAVRGRLDRRPGDRRLRARAAPRAGEPRHAGESFEDRHGARSTIVISQLPVETWHDYVADPTIAYRVVEEENRDLTACPAMNPTILRCCHPCSRA